MQTSPYDSWIDSLNFLRNCVAVPAALSNAATLLAARQRWAQHVQSRTSMHNLLFTMPGADFPFARSVIVQVNGVRHVVRLMIGRDVREIECTANEVDRVVDEALEALVAPAQICRACGASSNSPDFTGVFERMHFTCFHFEFEHGDVDRDQPCGLEGCPAD